MNYYNELLEKKVICKSCGKTEWWGEMFWLNGKCMCPTCYREERAKEDQKQEEGNENH